MESFSPSYDFFFIFLYIVYLVISYIIHLASLPQKFLYSVGGTSKSTTSIIFCTFLHILKKFAPFQQYPSLNRIKVPFMDLPPPPPSRTRKIHEKYIFHRYLYTCRKIFAFSREISREVYFWRIFEENGKIVVLGILGIKISSSSPLAIHPRLHRLYANHLHLTFGCR